MPNKRRSFGQIDKLPSGKYRARYTGPDSKLHKAPKTFFAKDDAAGWLRDEQKLIAFDAWTPPATRNRTDGANSLTVGAWIEQWLDLRSRGTNRLEDSTLDVYRRTFNQRVLKAPGRAGDLKDIRLTELTRRDVASWWDEISRAYDSPVFNRSAYVRLHTALQAAVDRDLIPTNPVQVADAKKRPKARRKELPEVEVMQAIVDALDHSQPRVDGRHKLIAILTFFHGLRIGEALALRREDVELVDGGWVVHVRGTAWRERGRGMVRKDSPKTEAGYRAVPVFPKFNADVEWHLAHKVGDRPDALLFLSAKGELIMDTSYRSILGRAKIRAGYENVRLTPHYGRVWLITTLAEQGMPIPAIGELLGQVDLRTITEVYMRSTEGKKRQVIRQVGETVFNTGDK